MVIAAYSSIFCELIIVLSCLSVAITTALHKVWYDDPKILFLLYQNLVY